MNAPFVQSGPQVSQATYPLSCIEEPQHGALVWITWAIALVQGEAYQLLDGSTVHLQYKYPCLCEGCVVAPKTPLSHCVPSCLEYQEGFQQICLRFLPWVPSANTSTICKTSHPPHKWNSKVHRYTLQPEVVPLVVWAERNSWQPPHPLNAYMIQDLGNVLQHVKSKNQTAKKNQAPVTAVHFD